MTGLISVRSLLSTLVALSSYSSKDETDELLYLDHGNAVHANQTSSTSPLESFFISTASALSGPVVESLTGYVKKKTPLFLQFS